MDCSLNPPFIGSPRKTSFPQGFGQELTVLLWLYLEWGKFPRNLDFLQNLLLTSRGSDVELYMWGCLKISFAMFQIFLFNICASAFREHKLCKFSTLNQITSIKVFWRKSEYKWNMITWVKPQVNLESCILKYL